MDVQLETKAPSHAEYFPHNIVILIPPNDAVIDERLDWLHENVGRNGSKWDWWAHANGTHTQVSFAKLEDAIQFKLTFI